MATLDSLIEATTMAARTSAITGRAVDGASAAGYGAWINSVTGSYPTVVRTSEGRARVVHTPDQVQKMQTWIDRSLFSAMKPGKEKGPLQIDFGAIITPVALKYAVLFGAAAFLGGWFTRGAIK